MRPGAFTPRNEIRIYALVETQVPETGFRVPDRYAICIDQGFQGFGCNSIRVIMCRKHVNVLPPIPTWVLRLERRDDGLNEIGRTSTRTHDCRRGINGLYRV